MFAVALDPSAGKSIAHSTAAILCRTLLKHNPMVCATCKCKNDCMLPGSEEPCEDCISGADGSHKRLPRALRLNDASEQPDAIWDNEKLGEVPVAEGLEYLRRKLKAVNQPERQYWVEMLEEFYNDHLEDFLWDIDAADEDRVKHLLALKADLSDSQFAKAVDAACQYIRRVFFPEMPESEVYGET